MERWRIVFLIAVCTIFYASIFLIPFPVFFLLTNFLLSFFAVLIILMYFEDKPIYGFKSYNPLITVVVPCYNDGIMSVETIKSILNSTYKKVEIIAINDCSTDNSLELISKMKGPKVKIINNKVNIGKAASLNKAVRMAKGELILGVDGDTIVEKHAIANAVKIMKDEKIGAVVGFIKVKNTDRILGKIQEIEYLVSFGFWSKALGNYDSLFITYGPFALYKKKVLKEVGLYDEKNITEDMDIGMKIRKAGYNIVRSNKSIVYTYVPDRLKGLFKQRTRWNRGKIFNVFKHREMLFRTKPSFFGKMLLPFSFVIEFMAVAILLRSMYLTLDYLLKLIQSTVTLFKVDSSLIVNKALYFSTVNSTFYFIIEFLLLTIIVVYFSMKIGEKEITFKNSTGMLLYLTIYSIMLPIAYLNAIRLEALNYKNKW